MSQIVLASDKSLEKIDKISVVRLGKVLKRLPKHDFSGKMKVDPHLIFSRYPEAEKKYGAKRMGSFWVVAKSGNMSQITIRSAENYIKKGYPTAIVIN